VTTAREYAIFCQMYLNGGVYRAKAIPKAETVAIATSPTTRSIQGTASTEQQSFYGYGWRWTAKASIRTVVPRAPTPGSIRAVRSSAWC